MKDFEKQLVIRVAETPLTEESLAGLSDLEELHINGVYDDAVTLPASFFELTQLKKLCLSNIRLPEMPDLSQFHRLQHISFFDLGTPDLENTRLSPECSLLELDIRRNGLTALPSWLARHPRLEELDAGGQRLTTEGLEPLRELRALRDVSFYDAGLPALPDFVAEWKQLERIVVSGCAFETFPPELVGLTQIRRLELGFNMLDGFPDAVLAFGNLEHLDLAGNDEVEVIPEALGELAQLRDLLLSSTSVESLPSSLARLSKLEYLSLEETPIAGEDPDNRLGDAIVAAIQGFGDESMEARVEALEKVISEHDPDAEPEDDED